MTIKVRRGLGLLVVAVIAFVVAFVAAGTNADGFVGDWVLPSAFVIGVIGGALLLLVGLAMVAWGLLRD